MEEYYSIKEFAEKANISQQAVYKQLAGRLEPYVILEGKQKKIKAAALKEFYSTQSQKVEQPIQPVEQPRVELVENPEPEGTREDMQGAAVEQPIQPEFNPNSTRVEQPIQPDERQQNELEQKIEELQQQLNKLIQESAEEKAFLREQIQKKDKQIEDLSESLKREQQLAAADKKILLELADKGKQQHEEKAAASDIVIDPDKEPEEQPQKKSFWQRLFGR